MHKTHFIRNVVKPIGRVHLDEKDMSKYELEQLHYNEELREADPLAYL